MRKYIFMIFAFVAIHCAAQEETEVVDTVSVEEIMEWKLQIPQFELSDFDWVDICDNPKYAIVTRGNLMGIYDMELHKNITRIEFRDLGFSKQIMTEDSAYISHFYFRRGIKNGLICVFEKDNSIMSIYNDDPEEVCSLEECTTVSKKISKRAEKLLNNIIKEQQLDNAQVVILDAKTSHLKTWIARDADMQKENAGKLLLHSCAGSLMKPFHVIRALGSAHLALDSIYNGVTYREGIKQLDNDVMHQAIWRGYTKNMSEKIWSMLSNTKEPALSPMALAVGYNGIVHNGSIIYPTMKADSVNVEKNVYSLAEIENFKDVLRVDKSETALLNWLTDATEWFAYATMEDICSESDALIGKQIQFAGVFSANNPCYVICVVADKLSENASPALLQDIVNPLSQWLLKKARIPKIKE